MYAYTLTVFPQAIMLRVPGHEDEIRLFLMSCERVLCFDSCDFRPHLLDWEDVLGHVTDVQQLMEGGNICHAAAQMFPQLNGLFRGDITFHKTWRVEPSPVHIRYALADVVLIYMLWCAYNRSCANSKDNARLPSQEATKK